MSSPAVSRAIPVTQLALGEASMGAAYVLVGTFLVPLEIVIITSTLDAAVQVSFDGVHDHIPMGIGSTVPSQVTLNFKANRTNFAPVSVFVKNIGTPSAGSLFVSGFSALIP